MKSTSCLLLIIAVLCAVSVSATSLSNQSAEIRIVFKQRNIDILKSIVYDISNHKSKNYGKYLTHYEIKELISPPRFALENVEKWLMINNIYQHQVKDHGDVWKVKADIGTLQKLLSINLYQIPNSKMSMSYESYTIPFYLQDIVEFIGGIYNKDYKKIRRNMKINVNSSDKVDPGYMGREVLCRLYNFDCDYTIVNNVSVCAVEYQDNEGFLQSDVFSSQTNNGQMTTNINNIVGVNYGTDGESELDVQMISQTANGVQEWFWNVDGWLYEFASDYFNTKNSPDVTSHSWGWAEDEQCNIIQCGNMTSEQYVQRVNNEYLKLVALGKTICAAAGDAGAPGRTSESCGNNRPVNAIFPGSSPWIVSVGATFVVSSKEKVNWTTPLCQQFGCAAGFTERQINFEETGWTAGGGFAKYANRTSWQDRVVRKYIDSGVPLPNNFSRFGRAYPDVTAIGHNCPTWIGGQLNSVDGTSCSSPVFAGMIGLLNDYQTSKGKPKLGLATPLLYFMAQDEPTTFNDILSGNNWCTEGTCCPVRSDGGSDYGYTGSCGYDPVNWIRYT